MPENDFLTYASFFGDLTKTGLELYQNYRLAEDARNFEREQWNLTNEYNTPANQMLRFKEAGLNPNLIYGQGSSGNASNYSPTHQQPVSLPNLGGSFLSAVNEVLSSKRAQADLKRAESEANSAFFRSFVDEHNAEAALREDLFDSSYSGINYAFGNPYKRGYIVQDLNSLSHENLVRSSQYYPAFQKAAFNDLFNPLKYADLNFKIQELNPRKAVALDQKWDTENLKQTAIRVNTDVARMRKRLLEHDEDWYDAKQYNRIINGYLNTAVSAAGVGLKLRAPKYQGHSVYGSRDRFGNWEQHFVPFEK